MEKLGGIKKNEDEDIDDPENIEELKITYEKRT